MPVHAFGFILQPSVCSSVLPLGSANTIKPRRPGGLALVVERRVDVDADFRLDGRREALFFELG